MIDYQSLVKEVKDLHCGACAAGLAIRALEELARNEMSEIPTGPIPAKTEKSSPHPKKSEKAELPSGGGKRECSVCHTAKSAADFPPKGNKCKACVAEYARKWYQKNHGSGS